MNFNSWQFLVFLPIVLLLYWIIPHRFRWIFLLAASYFFYMCWNAWLIFLIVGTTLVSYLAGILMERTEKKSLKKFYLVTAIIVCLGVLVFFKYFNFLCKTAIDFLNLFTLKINDYALDIILPIGISFYTFQTLSYVIDVYKGKFPAEKHLGYYALFVSFFPQLVAGPIERPGDLIPQLKEKHYLNKEDFFCGLRILAVGFFYKCVLADFLGIFVNRVFNNVGGANSLSIIIASLIFSFQIFGDFAGYSEIATGVARMMGIRLTKNFNRSYMPTSYSDFFRRWHITLSRWFTDYVYIPLGGSRKGTARRVFNTFVVFILCGLWHGANLTYLIWGLYVAFFMCLEFLISKPIGRFLNKKGINTESKTMLALRVIGMYLLFIPAGIIFRANNISELGELFVRLFTTAGFGAQYFESAMTALGLNAMSIVGIVLFSAAAIMLWHFAEIGRDGKEEILPLDKNGNYVAAQRTVVFIYVVIAVMLCWTALLYSGDVSQFQYFQF